MKKAISFILSFIAICSVLTIAITQRSNNFNVEQCIVTEETTPSTLNLLLTGNGGLGNSLCGPPARGPGSGGGQGPGEGDD